MHKKDPPTELVLPPELLEKIYKRLLPNDRIRFGSVCKAWLSAVISVKPRCPPSVPEPWLMRGQRDPCRYLCNCKFHCLSDQRAYKFDNVVPKRYKVVTMSSDGWLLTESHLSSHFKLVNLLSNAQIHTPLLPDSPFDVKNIKKVKKLIVLESIATILIMLAPCRGSTGLGIIRYSDNKFRRLSFMTYDDIVLYKGVLYALIIQNGFGIHVVVEEPGPPFYPLLIHGIAPNSRKDAAYLVESADDLLLVRRKRNNLLQTAGFDVFKLTKVETVDDYILNAVKLQSLGDRRALFWGRQGCFSVPVEQSSPFEEDHVYFIHFLKEQLLTEYGVYSLKDGSIKEVPNLDLPGPPSESFWFFPTVKDTTVYPKAQA